VDGPNGLHFYVVDKYTDAKGLLHYVLGIQNPAGAGPQTRGVSLAGAPSVTAPSAGGYSNCEFTLTNSGTDAPTDPALHPQDETASFHNDIYRLSAATNGAGWSAQLRNALATARFGQTTTVPVYVSRVDGAAPGVAQEYTASTAANVISTAEDASLAVSEPGHLTNGSFSLPEALRVDIAPNSWSGPVSNGASTITFRQHIGANDALRTGSYSKTLTFTLSTTHP
jgi:hypothetical protein